MYGLELDSDTGRELLREAATLLVARLLGLEAVHPETSSGSI
jgi:hypothetical protein